MMEVAALLQVGVVFQVDDALGPGRRANQPQGNNHTRDDEVLQQFRSGLDWVLRCSGLGWIGY